jgi:virulence factor Mce-like protein
MSGFRAGLVALALVAVGLFVGFNKGVPVGGHYAVKAVFASSNDLLVGSSIRPGSPVRIAGVEVGAIDGIERGPGDTAVVSLRIDDAGRPIHRDATVKIRPRLFLEGNFFVELTPGSPSAPELGDGATIPIAQTAIPVQLDDVLNVFERDTREDLKTTVQELATALDGGGAEAINRGYASWPGAFRNVAIAFGAGRGEQPHDLSAFVGAAARTARAVASRDRELGELVTSFGHTVATLAARREELASGLRDLRGLVGDAPPQLRAVSRATPAISTTSRAVLPALRRAPRVLDDTLPFLAVAGRLVAPAALPGLIGDLRPTIAALGRLEPKLGELLGLVAPVTACVRDHALPVLDATVDDGALSSGQPVWEEILHAAAGLVSSSQNFDGSGFSTRYSFGSGQDVVSLGQASQGGQELFALGAIQGSRPAQSPVAPPFRPDVPCETQALPDLEAEARPPVGQRQVARLDAAQLDLLGEALAGATGSGR